MPNLDPNKINLAMRQTPWYQQYFQQRHLDPNHVQLSDIQRDELTHLAANNGMPLPQGTLIDKAGNVNTHHGFAGQPGWLKALEIGGGAALTGGALGSLGLLGGAGAVGSGASAAGSSMIGGAASGVGALAPAALAGGAAAGGSIIGGMTSGAGLPSIAPSTSLVGGAPMAATGGLPSLAPSTSIVGGATTPSLAPSTSIVGGAGAVPSAIGHAPAITGGGTGGGSIIDRVLGRKGTNGITDQNGQNYADIGSMFEAYANGEAANRYAANATNQGHDRLMLDAAQNKRSDESDAMRKLAQTSYIASGGAKPWTPTEMDFQGQKLTGASSPSGITPISDAQKSAASDLEKQLLERMKAGGSYTPSTPNNSPGPGENIGKYGSLVTGGVGLAKNIFGF